MENQLVIPDTTAYLLLGIGVSFGVMVAIALRIRVKFTSLRKDMETLEQL
jgi:hypothetical protein